MCYEAMQHNRRILLRLMENLTTQKIFLNRDAGEGARGEQAPLLPFLKGGKGVRSALPLLFLFLHYLLYFSLKIQLQALCV